MGISRRIRNVPRDFKLGETWVFLGHPKAILEWQEIDGKTEAVRLPGIETVFRPTGIEYVIRDGEENDDARMQSLLDRGITPVRVRPTETSIDEAA